MNRLHLGQLLRRIRRRRGLKLRDLAHYSGLTVTFLSRLERGKLPNPTLKTLRKLAHVLDAPIGELVGEQAYDPASAPWPTQVAVHTFLSLGDTTPAILALEPELIEQQPGLQALADDQAIAAELLDHEWQHLKAWVSQTLARHGGTPTKARCKAELQRYRRLTKSWHELILALADVGEDEMRQVIDYVHSLHARGGDADV